MTTLRLFGKSISVSAYQVGDASQRALTVTGAITTDDVDPLAELVPIWMPSGLQRGPGSTLFVTPIAGTDGQKSTTGVTSGYLLGCSGALLAGTGTSSALYYVLFYDRVFGTAPVAADADQLLTIGPLVQGAVPATFGFDRSLRPSVRFSQGLCWVLSTTPQSYTAPVDGAAAFLDADYGV